jgi:hypothetical protein
VFEELDDEKIRKSYFDFLLSAERCPVTARRMGAGRCERVSE